MMAALSRRHPKRRRSARRSTRSCRRPTGCVPRPPSSESESPQSPAKLLVEAHSRRRRRLCWPRSKHKLKRLRATSPRSNVDALKPRSPLAATTSRDPATRTRAGRRRGPRNGIVGRRSRRSTQNELQMSLTASARVGRRARPCQSRRFSHRRLCRPMPLALNRSKHGKDLAKAMQTAGVAL